MKIFLLSESFKNIYVNGVKKRCEIDKKNQFAKNLKKSVKEFESFVFVSNNKSEYEGNEVSAKLMYKALLKEGYPFKKCVVLDERTMGDAKDIIENASLMYLQGGYLECQLEFLKEIEFKKHILNSKAVITGKSAGAMNLAKTVYQYPEDEMQMGWKKFLNGIDLFDLMIIPHFNVEKGNEFCSEALDMINDYYLPDSMGKKFYALPQGSYIIIEEDKATIFGETYLFKDGKMTKICEDENKLQLQLNNLSKDCEGNIIL